MKRRIAWPLALICLGSLLVAMTCVAAEPDSPAAAPAETAAPANAAPAAAAEPQASTAGTETPAAPADSDFDLFGDAPKTADLSAVAGVSAEVERRRAMLETHQMLGLSTLALMTISVVLGQLNYSDEYGDGGGRTGNYLWPHRITTYLTTGAFAATAGYSLFAPKPFKGASHGIDTTTIHKVAVIGATAGMITQVVLGFITARQADTGNASGLKDMATAHQVVGYATLGCLATAATVWVF
ncbi:MAG: hypothetical protein ACOYOB_15895 [Myxococcota bacterium]